MKKNTLLSGNTEILVGNRVPKDFFVTKGTGESNITVHAGSYHLALKDAGIEMYNIMTYSSILPGVANRVDRPETIVHGSVMESIMSVCNSSCGEIASAGIAYGWLCNRKSMERFGGLVCEHYGNYSKEHLRYMLASSLNELYINGFSEEFVLNNIEFIMESFAPNKAYGTAIVAICFVNYVVPVIGN